MPYTDETMQALADARAESERTLGGMGADLIAIWTGALAVLSEQLQKAVLSGNGDMERALRQAQKLAAEKLAEACTASSRKAAESIGPLVRTATTSELSLIESQLPADIRHRLADPPETALAATLRRTRQRITARHYYLSAEMATALRLELTRGIAEGLSPREVADHIMAATQNKFYGGLTRALVIARTEILDAYRAAAMATDQANRDILVGWQWYAQLDARTCLSCIAQHGRTYPIEEPGPLDHHQGRCTRLPQTKTWAELGFAGVPEPEGVRITPGPEWLEQLSPDTQQKIMGKSRYAAWQAGNYPPEMWSQPRETKGWRTSYHTGPVPE